MGEDHQRIYHRAWPQLGPPLRPPSDVILAVKEQISGISGRALLLGVTPELADVAPHLVAVDRNFSMVANVWPGNTRSRCAMVGDWRRPNFKSDAFSICVGDGSLSFLTFPDETAALFLELSRILRSGGRIVFRLYVAPAIAETTSALKTEALSGKIKSFHAFKIRLGMALVAQQSVPEVRVADILGAFNSLFRNRQELVQTAGWNREQVDTIDFYKDSIVSFTFPKRDQVLSIASKTFPNARFVSSGNYEMSELCPLLLADKA
jgi:SAM-dependent methyltransferase